MSTVEHSDRARYVTEQVSLWIQNDGEHIKTARIMVETYGVTVGFRNWVTWTLMDAPEHSAPWQVAQELAPNDWDRIHWDEVADAIRDQEDEEQHDMPLTGQDPGTPE